MQENNTIRIANDEEINLVRQSNDMVFASSNMSSTQINMINRALTKITLKPEEVKKNMIYEVEYQRHEIPKMNLKSSILKELKGLLDVRIVNVLDKGEEAFAPFPKYG